LVEKIDNIYLFILAREPSFICPMGMPGIKALPSDLKSGKH
jgi:hypothetical protein